jgi:hypothetical protein
MLWLKAAAAEIALLAWCCCGPLLASAIPALVWDKITRKRG